MAREHTRMLVSLTPEATAERLQSILINAAEGQRNIADDRQYADLRKRLKREKIGLSQMLKTHPTVDSFSAAIRSIVQRSERVDRIREDFAPLFRELEGSTASEIASSAWTGIESGVARVRAVKSLLPLAQTAIEGMIASLSVPNANGGPPLDQHEEAIENLRELHRTLGALLNAADSGCLEDEMGNGLAAEAARYAKRAARALSRDPMPYISSSLLLGLLTVCGFPTIGGFLADVALNIQKNAGTSKAP